MSKLLKIENATIGYDNKIIFKDANFEFEINKITAIIGQSGCGKSTILRTLAGLNKLKSGRVLFEDTQIKKPIPDICMMHQKYSNFPWLTCLDNVLIGKGEKLNKIKKDSERLEEAYSILKSIGLLDDYLKYPHELSGGMNQRLALARVLYRNPKVILMDEPLSALDPKTRNNMQELLLQNHYKTNNTIIMVTHDLDEAKKMANNIIKI